MIQLSPITDALPVVSHNFTVTPADFQDVPFTSAPLLPHSFDASLAAHADFLPACEAGYDNYFEDMWDDDCDGYLCFVDHFHTWDEVKAFIIENALPDPVGIRYSAACGWEPSLLAWRAGFCLGWLSALVLTDRPLALQGLALLVDLVAHQLFCARGVTVHA